MSTNTKLSIKSRSYADDKKTVTDNINYVNPNISSEVALELAQRLNALSKNSYQSTDKITTTELDEEVLKPVRIINSLMYVTKDTEIEFNSDGVANLTTSQIFVYNNRGQFIIRIRTPYDGEAPVIVNPVAEGTTVTMNNINFVNNRWNITWNLQQGDVPACSFSFTLHFNETSECKAFDKTLTFNVTTEG